MKPADEPQYEFYNRFRNVYENNISRVMYLAGNTSDLFCCNNKYVNIVQFLLNKLSNSKNTIPIVYEINGPIRLAQPHRLELKAVWEQWYKSMGNKENETFDDKLLNAVGKPHYGLEFLRQLTIANRTCGKSALFIILESAETMLPTSRDFASLNLADRRSIVICKDWFSDSDFLESKDTVLMICEGSDLNDIITKLPSSIEVPLSLPNAEQRDHYFKSVGRARTEEENFLSEATGSLTLQSIRQMSFANSGRSLTRKDVYDQIKSFMTKELGGLVEFKKPSHKLTDVVGNRLLKEFLRGEFIPRILASGEECISGAAIAGPIGSGKSFIFEAVAGEVGCPLLVLNLRSKYYGDTDLDEKRFERIVQCLSKVFISVEEADTEFGKLTDSNEMSVEKRLTGKIQAMMSNPSFRGKVVWLLDTARIHLLSDDIKRPGRAGDLIIPVFDPSEDDLVEFCAWTIKDLNLPDNSKIVQMMSTHDMIKPYSAAAFASLKSTLTSKKPKTWDEIRAVIEDIVPSDIATTRQYQRLQALLNTTRISLLMTDPEVRAKLINKNLSDRVTAINDLKRHWQEEAATLERSGKV